MSIEETEYPEQGWEYQKMKTEERGEGTQTVQGLVDP